MSNDHALRRPGQRAGPWLAAAARPVMARLSCLALGLALGGWLPQVALAQGAAAASTYFIGEGTVAGARSFATPAAFTEAVKCVRGGDRVWLESGRSFRGRLKLAECSGGDSGTLQPIEVRSVDPRQPQDRAARPARLIGSDNAATLGLAWRPVPAADASALGIAPRSGTRLLALGPLPRVATGLLLGDRWLPSASHPNADAATGLAPMVATSTLAAQGSGCSVALCLTTADADTLQLLQRLQATDQRNWPLVVFRNSPWSLSRHTLSEIDADRGTLRSADPAFGGGLPTGKLPDVGSGLLLLGAPLLIDQPGEWAFDAVTSTAYLLQAAADPVPDAAATELLLLHDSGNDSFMFANATLAFWGRMKQGNGGQEVQIDNIAVQGASGSGVRVLQSGRITLSRLDVRQAGDNGIVVFQAGGPVAMLDNQVGDVARNGIVVNAAAELQVRGNRIQRAGQIRLQSGLGMDFNGIRASGFSTVAVEDNTISDVGFAAISLGEPRPGPGVAESLQVRVAGNRINGFCRLLNDCGAIYVHGQVPASSKPAAVSQRRKQIVGNRIERPLGNLAGLPLQVRKGPVGSDKSGSWRRFVAAVYLDHGASGYDIADNEVAGLYEPYGWRVFNRGVGNSCDAAALAQCSVGGYACYTGALERCNRTAAATRP